MSCILVPNLVHSSLISHSLPPNLTAIKLNVKSVNIIWHVLPFQLRPDAVGAASRRIAFCVATYRPLHRHAVLGTSGAQLLPVWVSWWIEGKAKM